VVVTGFWLSFGSVAILIYGFSRRLGKPSIIKNWWLGLWVAWVGTLGLNIIFFQKISLVAIIANSIAIPTVTILVVPLIITGIATLPMFPHLTYFLWQIACWIMEKLWLILIKISQFPWAALTISHYHISLSIILALATLLFLLPRYILYSYWGWLLLGVGLYNKPPNLEKGSLSLDLIDVGQGLSLIVRTQNHSLLYDTGPKYFDYDLGKIAVLPYLNWLKINNLDKIIISHWDNDHSGGLESIVAQIPYQQILSSDQGKSKQAIVYCERGLHWNWDNVEFKFLYPSAMLYHLGNNSSCVLQITTGKHRILIPGDIEAFAEKILLEHDAELKSDILIAPHHGSKTSSTQRFVTAVDPQWVLFPVGWKNRFRLPNALVTQRYINNQSQLLRTDVDGAIHLEVSQSSISEPRISSSKVVK